MAQPTAPPVARFRGWPLVRCFAYVLVGYAGLILMLLSLENRLIYFPTTAEQRWEQPPSPDIEDVALTNADGTRIHAWWCPCPGSDQALLYCHGNAGNLSQRGRSIVKLRQLLNASVLIVDYPGYGKSEGSPTEQGCYQAADAGYAWLVEKQKIAPKKIILYGASLGGGVIVDVASRQEHRALILISTFASMPEVARDIYWWLPVPINALMSNRYNSVDKIKQCHRPVFISHGMADRIIPFGHGEKLYKAANDPKRFLPILDGDHNDSLPEDLFTSLKEFLKANPVD